MISYINYFLFFLAFIFTAENYRISNLNKDIVLLFDFFYFYNSCILVFSLGVRVINDPSVNLISFLYGDMGQTSIILMLSIYLFVISLNINIKNPVKLIIICGVISLVLTFVNYYKFILVPESYYVESMRELYVIKKYLFNLISIVFLLIFWIRYYNRFFVLSEYLNIIVFLFMLSNILDALHYISSQHSFEFFGHGLYISFVLNTFFIVFWHNRLKYLNSDIGIENEKYLSNYQFLEGLVSKPKQSSFQTFSILVSPNYLVLFLVLLVLGILSLYMAKFINLYLMINTVFIIVTTLLAVFYSFSSIKRNWTNQFGFMLKNKKEKA